MGDGALPVRPRHSPPPGAPPPALEYGSPANAGLSDLLRALPALAADTIVDALIEPQHRSHAHAARLACRCLRDLVDRSAPTLRLALQPGDLAHLRAGRLPSLARWPRAGAVSVRLCASSAWAAPDALLLVAPILEPTRLHITQLSLATRGDIRTAAELLVSTLAPQLPALRSLDLKRLRGQMSYDAPAQQAMFEALAAMPRLESLALPDARCLDCVGALAGSSSLRSLVVGGDIFTCNYDHFSGPECAPARPLNKQVLAGVVQLQGLQKLTIEGRIFSHSKVGEVEVGLVELLASLPPSVEELQVGAVVTPEWNEVDAGPAVTISLQRGSVRALALNGGIAVCDAGALARALLGCRALGPRLERLELTQLGAFEEGEDEELQPLLELYGRCGHVVLHGLRLGPNLPAAVAQQLVRLLPLPKVLELLMARENDFRFQLQEPESGAASSSLAAHQEQRDHTDPLSPTAEGLLGTAVQQWVSSERLHPGSCVCVRGPAVAGACSTRDGRAAWALRLAERAGVSLDRNGGIAWFRVLPSAAVVLVECTSSSVAAAVAAAAATEELAAAAAAGAAAATEELAAAAAVAAAAANEELAAAAAGAAVAAAEGLTAAAAVAARAWAASPGAPLLEVVLVQEHGMGNGPAGRLLKHAKRVAQELLDGQHGGNAWSKQERVMCVLQLWVLLMEPPMFTLF